MNTTSSGPSVQRVAIISVHGCPNARLGSRDTGGMNVYVRQVAQELSARGVYVDIYTREHEPDEPQFVELAERARVIHLAAGSIALEKEELPGSLPEFARGLSDFTRQNGLTYDVIHSHYWLSGRVGNVLSSHWRVPHVATFHTLAEVKLRARAGEREPEARAAGERRTIASADRIVAFSEHERDAISRLYDSGRDHIAVIPCGVDVDRFQPLGRDSARGSLGFLDSKVVLYVGRVEPLKGIDILLRAVAQLGQSESVRTLIIGGESEGDSEVERLKALAGELGISSLVSFVGRVEQRELPAYYSAADVCVVPSYYESFGLVALESMACGTPVVASRVGGLPTIVKDGETGYLVPWRCPEPFADRMDILLSSPDVNRSMGEAARRRALTMGWPAVADRLLSLYASLVSPDAA